MTYPRTLEQITRDALSKERIILTRRLADATYKLHDPTNELIEARTRVINCIITHGHGSPELAAAEKEYRRQEKRLSAYKGRNVPALIETQIHCDHELRLIDTRLGRETQ